MCSLKAASIRIGGKKIREGLSGLITNRFWVSWALNCFIRYLILMIRIALLPASFLVICVRKASKGKQDSVAPRQRRTASRYLKGRALISLSGEAHATMAIACGRRFACEKVRFWTKVCVRGSPLVLRSLMSSSLLIKKLCVD